MFQKYSSVSIAYKSLELLGMLLLLILYTLGRVLSSPAVEFEKLFSPYSMKVILSFGLLYSYYRLFGDYLPVSPTLGPLLYRFRYMCMYDFVHFMRMALILLISSGIVIQSILYPNTELSMDTFHKVSINLYGMNDFSLLGEIFHFPYLSFMIFVHCSL